MVVARRSWNPARLAKARRDADLTQEALAERLTEILGRSAQPVRARNIVRWERPRGASGAHAPHIDFVPAIAAATGKETDFFFGDDAADGSDDEEDPRMREAFVLFVDLMERITERKAVSA